jgi:hypothetical protein
MGKWEPINRLPVPSPTPACQPGWLIREEPPQANDQRLVEPVPVDLWSPWSVAALVRAHRDICLRQRTKAFPGARSRPRNAVYQGIRSTPGGRLRDQPVFRRPPPTRRSLRSMSDRVGGSRDQGVGAPLQGQTHSSHSSRGRERSGRASSARAPGSCLDTVENVYPFVAFRHFSTMSLAMRPLGATLIRFALAQARTTVRS